MKLGNCSKNSEYLKLITRAIEKDPKHPRRNGIKMQAHHIVSGEGMKRSGLGRKIEKFGYDINLLPNLVFIPCTLQGACYLGVQPHRGNHTAEVDQDDYVDDLEPNDYHDMVARELKRLEQPLLNECAGEDVRHSSKVIDELNILSKKILALIVNKPGKARLTEIADHFGIEGKGCAGVDSVPLHKKTSAKCPVHRNHHFNPEAPNKSQGPHQKQERITYVMEKRYTFTVGK